MKATLILLHISLMTIILFSCHKKDIGSKPVLKNEIDSISYYTGIFAARTLQNYDTTGLNSDAFYQGIQEVFQEKTPKMNKLEANSKIGQYFNKFRIMQSETAIQEGQTFLAWNKTRNGIITDTSGLQYKVIQEGKGAKPGINDLVLIHYKGFLTNGTEFINSYKQGHPDTIPLKGNDIPGLYLALQKMRVGSIYKVYIPSKLGFGFNPPPFEGLKPNMVVIFEVELLSVVHQKSDVQAKE
jgi:FKBP-type peptidyl-prolyl cis-trans isomerase